MINRTSSIRMGRSQQAHCAAAPQPPETLMPLVAGKLPLSSACRIRTLNDSARVWMCM
jgi:hypothetical protein